MEPVLFDFESQSGAELTKVGGRNYAKHDSTRVLCGVFLIDGTFHVWLPRVDPTDLALPCFDDLWPKQHGEPRPIRFMCGNTLSYWVQEAIEHGRTFTAHNADSFDKHIWTEKINPVPLAFGDTIHAARALGLPAGLDKLGQRFFGFGKDAGASIMSRLWKLEYDFENNEWFNKNETPGNVAAAARYCIADVCILERVYAEVKHAMPDVGISNEINARGIAFDAKLARQLIDFGNRAAEEAKAKIAEITNGELSGDDIRSVAKVKRWLKSRGVPLESLNKRSVEQLLSDPDAFIASLQEENDNVGENHSDA